MNKRKRKKFARKNFCKTYARCYDEINESIKRSLNIEFDPLLAQRLAVAVSVARHIIWHSKFCKYKDNR